MTDEISNPDNRPQEQDKQAVETTQNPIIGAINSNLINHIENADKPKEIVANKPKYRIEPRWKPGIGGNPSGRPKGTDYITQFREALKAVEKKKGQAFLSRCIELAYDPKQASTRKAVIERMVPALAHIEISDTTQKSLLDLFAQIQAKKVISTQVPGNTGLIDNE